MSDNKEERRWQKTDFVNNNNKFWGFEREPGSSSILFKWGRVGDKGQQKLKVMSDTQLYAKIREQEREGYVEVQLHRPQVVVVPAATEAVGAHPKVTQIVSDLFKEAGEHIKGYLSTTVDMLSSQQIDQGRRHLAVAQQHYAAWSSSPTVANEQRLTGVIQDYYNAIPTQMPRRPNIQQIVRDFCADFHEQETRLDQLEAALATKTVAGTTQTRSLGCDIDVMDTSDPRYAMLKHYVESTCVHDYDAKVIDIFAVRIPSERDAWERSQRGKDNIKTLFHGTRFYNVRHILKSGMRIPTTAANGWNFGRGIYWADKSTKSYNYTSAQHVDYMTLLVGDVALGKMHTPSNTGNWTEAPFGCDSIFAMAGKSSWLKFNEFVVFTPPQMTIRFLVTASKNYRRRY